MQIVLWLLPRVVFGLAAYLGLGKLGEMPQHAVHDRPKGRIPDGPVDEAFLAEARIPVAAHGYDRGQVDGLLRRIADGEGVEPGAVLFDVVRRGYDMQVVDDLLDRPQPAAPGAEERLFRPDSPPAWSDKE